jgi:hypothetical protein
MKKWLIIAVILVIILIVWYFAYGKKWIEKRKRAKEIQKIAAGKGQELSIRDAAALADAESEMSTAAFRTFATSYIQSRTNTGGSCECKGDCSAVFPGTVKVGCIWKDGECVTKCEDKETGAVHYAKPTIATAQSVIANQLFSV